MVYAPGDEDAAVHDLLGGCAVGVGLRPNDFCRRIQAAGSAKDHSLIQGSDECESSKKEGFIFDSVSTVCQSSCE